MKLSIVIPVYNVEKYIARCLDSVLKQLTDEVEIIVINDGTTDSSMNICKEMIGKGYRNVKILSQENKGLAATRNRGIEEAKSEYIMFLDSDDELASDTIEKLLLCFEKYEETDIFYFDAEIVEEETKVARRNPYNRKNKVYGLDMIKGLDYFKNYYVDMMIVSVCLCVFKLELLKNNRLFFDINRLYEDNIFSFRALLTSKHICYLPYNLYIRRYRKNSITVKKPQEKNIVDICFLIRRYMEYKQTIVEFDDCKVSNAYLALIYKTFCWGNSEYIRSGLELQCMDELIEEICNAFDLWPKKFQGSTYLLFRYYFLRKSTRADNLTINKIHRTLEEKYRMLFGELNGFSNGRIAIYGRGKHTDILKSEYRKLMGKEMSIHVYLDSFDAGSVAEDGIRVVPISKATEYADAIILSSNYYRLEMLQKYNEYASSIPMFDFYEVEKMDMFEELLF